MVHIGKYSPARTIHRVDWGLRMEITERLYFHHLCCAESVGFAVREWRGEDREGGALVVRWVVTGNGRVVSAYEIQERA